MPGTAASTWFLRLGVAVLPLLAIASIAGVAWPGLYRDPDVIAAQAIGQDWVTLLLAVPALAIGLVAARRGSRLARIVALGVLGYAAYAYALYAFGTRHNELFLVYVAILGLSVWGLVAGLAAESAAARLAPRVPPRLAWRWIGGLFIALAVVFAGIWLSEIIPALVRGETPRTVQEWGTPTNGVHVLDLGFVLPILAWTGVRLWRREPAAVVVGGVLLFKVTTLGIAILAMGLMQFLRGQAVDVGLVGVFVVMTALSIVTAAQYARALRRAV
jgi:hypothetical protein